jgi:O-antigen/teichoic acid export membrane protein
LLTLAFYVVLARLASPDDFGDLAAGMVIVSAGFTLSESGMLAALIHRPDRIEEAASTAAVSTAAAGVVFGLAGLAASPLIGAIFDSSRIGDVAAAASGLLLLHPLRVVPEALLQRRFSFLRRVVIEPAGVIAFGATAVVLCANGLGVWGLLIGYYARAALETVLSWGFVRWRPNLSLASFGMWRELIRYGRFGLGATALERLTEQVPVVLLGRYVSSAQLGQYRIAQRIAATPLAVIVQSGSYVIFPAMARITANRERLRGAAVRSLRMMSTIAFPLGLALVPLGLPGAVLIFGNEWRDAGYAAMALSLFPIAGTLTSFASEVAKADGRPDIVASTQGIQLLAGAGCMVALLPFDLVGVAAGFGLGWLAGGLYSVSRVARLLETARRRLFAEALPALVAALAMVAVVTPLEFLLVNADDQSRALGLALLAGEALLALAVYVGSMRLLAPATLRELRDLVAGLRDRGAQEAERQAAEAGEPVHVPDELEILDEPRP